MLVVGVYLLLEWGFAYVTAVEGIITPRAAPRMEALAIGAAYLVVRVFVRLVLPAAAVTWLVRLLLSNLAS
jgi:hypothetical protein